MGARIAKRIGNNGSEAFGVLGERSADSTRSAGCSYRPVPIAESLLPNHFLLEEPMSARPDDKPPAMVTGLFKRRESAERAWRAAVDLGYRSDDINLMLSEETRDRLFRGEHRAGLSAKAAEAAEEPARGAEKMGGPTGGHVGMIAPVLAAVGTLLLVPGGIIAAGPVAIALGAAGAVGVAGGVIGALTNWGVPKSRLELYEQGIRDGGVLIGVNPRTEGDSRKLVDAWKASGGELVHS